MGIGKKFKSLHLDVLREIGNIGAGNAATALSILLDKKIEMKVPAVRLISFDEMLEWRADRRMLLWPFIYVLKVMLQGACFLFFRWNKGLNMYRR